jgi:hypothetical protein
MDYKTLTTESVSDGTKGCFDCHRCSGHVGGDGRLPLLALRRQGQQPVYDAI